MNKRSAFYFILVVVLAYFTNLYFTKESISEEKNFPTKISQDQQKAIEPSVDKAPQTSEPIREAVISKKVSEKLDNEEPEEPVQTTNSQRNFMPASGKIISSIEFPTFSLLDATNNAIIDRLKFYREKAREKKQIGQDLFLAGAAHNAYLANQSTVPAERRDLLVEKEVTECNIALKVTDLQWVPGASRGLPWLPQQ